MTFTRVAFALFGVKKSRALLLGLMFAACHAGPKPAIDPAPVTVPRNDAKAASRPSPVPLPTVTAVPRAPRADDVNRTAVDVFGDGAAPAPAADSAIAGPTWDMDVRSYENQERVAFYVNFFTGNSRSRFQERLRLGTRYEPMIRAKLRAGGIPEDMSYLALVESGFDPNAYSSAAAVGMWQFMSSTARDVGLRVDWWLDERRDPARSTDAAVRFIHDLQMQFGSLYLAAAAYNGGPGRVSRGLTRFAEDMAGSEGEDRFFALAEHDYLRSETRNYVPQIIAAALVGKEAVRYGFAFDTLSQYAYDSVEVAAGVPLSTVAKASETPLGVIKELNPAVLRGITPPNSSLWVRIPVNCGITVDQIAGTLAGLSPDDRIGYRSVKATGAETVAGLAVKGGVSSREIGWYNPGLKTTKKGKVLAGQTILIPTAFAVAGATNAPDPGIEHYGPSAVALTRNGSVHIVKRGESMGAIAARYHMTVARLKALNGIRGNRVVAGQALRLKSSPTMPVSGTANGTLGKSVNEARTAKVHVAGNTAATSKPAANKSTSGTANKTLRADQHASAGKSTAARHSSLQGSGANKSSSTEHGRSNLSSGAAEGAGPNKRVAKASAHGQPADAKKKPQR